MRDVELASCLLEKEGLNLVIVKGGQVLHRSKEKGLRSFFQAILSIGDGLHNAAVADRIMGSALAMLCLYARIATVYAIVGSEGALVTLQKHGVDITAEEVIPHILNSNHTDLCPFEKLAQRCRQPSQLFSALESLFIEAKQ